jgi:hypothetical protein
VATLAVDAVRVFRQRALWERPAAGLEARMVFLVFALVLDRCGFGLTIVF